MIIMSIPQLDGKNKRIKCTNNDYLNSTIIREYCHKMIYFTYTVFNAKIMSMTMV